MNQLRRILSFLFLAAALLLLAQRAGAQNYVAPVVKPTPPGQLIVVNNGPGDQTDPHVDGDLVCYTDQVTGSVIRYFNLATQTDNSVPPGFGSLDFLCDVRGTTIVFTRSTSQADIFTVDTASQTLTELDPTPGSMRFTPRIGDQTIVWSDFANTALGEAAAIVAYDRTTGATTTIAAAAGDSIPGIDNVLPGISPDGSIVVWEACAAFEISQRPCSISKSTRLTAGAWTPAQQVISHVQGVSTFGDLVDTDGTIIAYTVRPSVSSNTGQLVWQPVAGGTEQVINLPGLAIDPSVSAGMIAFAYDATGSGNHEIALYNVAANVLYHVTSDVAGGVLPPGGNRTLNDVSVTPDGKVRIVWQEQDPSDSNVYAYTFNLPLADLAIQKYAFPSTVHVGQGITYGLLVRNLGPNTATDVVVTDPLPANTVFVGAVPTQGSCTGPAVGSTGTVACNLGSLVNGGYAVVGIAVKVTGGAGTTITNTATVGPSSLDPSPNNNSASVSTSVAQP